MSASVDGSDMGTARLGPEAHPLLSTIVTVVRDDRRLALTTDSLEFEYTGESARVVEGVATSLDGSRSLGELAAEIGTTAAYLGDVLGPLLDEHLLLDAEAAGRAPTGDVFLEAFARECQFWGKAVPATPYWRRLLSGQATRNEVLGWGIEYVHYVDSVNEYMAAGIAHCRAGAEVREWLSRHYVEEADHARIFLDGLAGCGLDPRQVAEAPPLASTRALINFLYETAVAGTIPYAAVFGVMQPRWRTADATEFGQLFEYLDRLYDWGRPLFEAFRRHTVVDVNLAHESIVLERICRGRESIPAHEATLAVAAARGVAEHFVLFYEGLGDYYVSSTAQLPRRPVRTAAV